MNKFYLMILSLFRRREKIERIESWLDDGTIVEEDWDVYDIKSSLIDLYNPHHNGDNLALVINSNELIKQIKGYYPLGAKSLNYYFANQNLIPEEFKKKTSLFMGTIYRNSNGGRFVPCLYFHSLRTVWIKSFYCLEDRVSLKHNFVPVLKEPRVLN
jgi:hypothetical protein